MISVPVKVVFYSEKEGGRRQPVFNGYRTSILFGLTKDQSLEKGKVSGIKNVNLSMNSSGLFRFVKDKVEFAVESKGVLSFNRINEKVEKYLKPNCYILIFEGDRIVGRGVILSND